MIAKVTQPQLAVPLLRDWQETMLWSCLQGVMGALYAPEGDPTLSAMAILGDFCFLAGAPDRSLVAYKPNDLEQDFIIMVPQHEGWSKLIEDHWDSKATRVSRYAFQKETEVFDRTHLNRLAESLPDGYVLRPMDEDLYHRCRQENWSRDLVSQFPDYAVYRRHGAGVLVLQEGQIVSGASSYSTYAGASRWRSTPIRLIAARALPPPAGRP